MATPSGVSSSGLNFTGLATGIDTAKIITGLTQISQARIDGLTRRQSDLVTKQTTFAALQGQLFNLRSAANQMARAAGGAFDGRTAGSSDPTALTVAAGTAAATGTYTVGVAALAQAHQIASQGFADPTTALKTGTVSLQVGTGAATTVTLDTRNATLQGLADAINAATGDVRAAVINDGSATPYRLLLTATKTGSANALQVTASLTGGTGADLDPAATTLQAAADARVTLGTGPGALTVASGTNQISGLIPGVTLNLLRADPAKPLTVSVANDTDAAAKAVQNFVDAYNGVQGFIAARTGYDPTTKQAGELLGNRDLAALADDLAGSVSATVPGLNPAANRLSSVGLSFDDKGKLLLDTASLGRALNGDTGVPITEVKRLFALSGTSDNPGVMFAYGSDKTKASGASPVHVQVTAPATRATIIAAGPPATSVTVLPANATLQLKLNGLVASGVSLDAGTYTTDELAAMLQRRSTPTRG